MNGLHRTVDRPSRTQHRRSSGAVAIFGALLVGFIASIVPSTSRAEKENKDKDKIEIEGVVADRTGTCPTVQFNVAGKRVMTDKQTKFEDGNCNDLANGKEVEIEGTPDQNGTIRAREVDFD